LASFWTTIPGLRWTLGTIVVAYLINMLIYSFLVEPLFRYQVLGTAMCAFAAGAGAYAILCGAVRAISIVVARKCRPDGPTSALS